MLSVSDPYAEHDQIASSYVPDAAESLTEGTKDQAVHRIILADNHSIFRTGTAKVLSMEEDFRIIAQCPDNVRLQSALGTYRDATVLFSSTLVQDPTLFMEQILSLDSRGIAILEIGESAQPYMVACAHGVCFRSITRPTLVDCVRRVTRGERALHSLANGSVMLNEDPVGARVRHRLSRKELQIVGLVAKGCKNREIGIRLSTTEQVIKNYLRIVYDKIGVSDRLELALFTIHHNVLNEAAVAALTLITKAA